MHFISRIVYEGANIIVTLLVDEQKFFLLSYLAQSSVSTSHFFLTQYSLASLIPKKNNHFITDMQ